MEGIDLGFEQSGLSLRSGQLALRLIEGGLQFARLGARLNSLQTVRQLGDAPLGDLSLMLVPGNE